MLSIRKIGVVGRTYRHLNRYRRILAVFLKYGFDDLVDRLRIDQYIEAGLQLITRNKREHASRHSRAVRVRMALEELGPTFIKLGQVLSTRPDLVPFEFVKELASLQDNVPPSDIESTRKVLSDELHQPLEEIFSEFDTIPVASASIGQVHRAALLDGEPVAVKIQRPGIRKLIEVDLEIMLHLATLMERHITEMAFHRPIKIVEELARTLERELDYTLEASSLERIASYYLADPSVCFPKVYREVSTTRVLTMEYIEGIKISDIEAIEDAGLDPKQICRRGADFYLDQIFVRGFFHADPHPGNILVKPDNVICLLDFGMMGAIDQNTREDFVDLVDSVVNRRVGRTTRLLLKITEWEKEPDMRAFERDTEDFMERHLYKPLKEIEVGRLLHRLMELSSRYRLRIPPDTFLMMKALATVEGVARSLDPDFDMVSQTAPFIEKVKLARFRPRRVAGDVIRFGSDMVRFMDRFPKDLMEVMRLLKQRHLTLRMELDGFEALLSAHHQITNRLSFAIIIGALLIGSALIVISKAPPLFYGISLIGIIGFLFAAVMGIWLLIAILKKGRL